MKKIIAISVMFVLIAGAAFADTSVGGNLRLGADLLKDKGSGDDVLAGHMWLNDANTKVEWSGDNAGGLMKLHSFGSNNGTATTPFWTPDIFTFVWWKPIDQLRLQFGKNADGDWGHAQITGWGYNAEAQASVAIDQDMGLTVYGGPTTPLGSNRALVNTARSAGFWGGFGAFGTAITISPIPGFDINLGIPMGGDNDAASFYSNTKINFKYDLPDIGTIRLAADLNKANKDADLIPDIYFAFYLSAIENMGVDLGIAMKASGLKDDENKPYKNDRIEVGIGYRLTADDLGLKVRLGFVPVIGKVDGDDKPMEFAIGILPSYNLGALTVYVNAGFGMYLNLPEGVEAGDYSDFIFNPYIAVPLNAGKFYAGVKVAKLGSLYGKDALTTWSIPIGWNVYF